MIISIIAAISNNHIIGNKNHLPWKMTNDMKYFKRLILNKPIIMGSLTFESIGKPLKDSDNIILTKDFSYKASGCKIAHSLEEALLLAQKSTLNNNEVMICGGASVYKQYLPMTDRMYLTIIEHDFKGDSFFPKFNTKEWKQKEKISHEPNKDNPYKYSFLVLERD